MPVTFSVASHAANPVQLQPTMVAGLTAKEIMENSCEPQYKTVDEFLQSSLSDTTERKPPSDRGSTGPKRNWTSMTPKTIPKRKEAVDTSISSGTPGRDWTSKIPNIMPKRNGFVDTVISAYNQHHALIIRPDDVWMTILTQFNYFVNANAEVLRANFVAHEGQRELTITAEGTRYTLDFGAMSREMVDELEKNIVDPSLREWVLPNFTTTTMTDTTVSAILMMATLKAFFKYQYCGIECGIPRVTLEGEKSDWKNILGRLEKLKEFGIETIAWYHLLRPVISRFVAAFDAPESRENIDFWQKVAHMENMGSGPDYYSGWINAFCVFNDKGKWIGNPLKEDQVSTTAPETLSAEEFRKVYQKYSNLWQGSNLQLELDGAEFHQVDATNMPPCYAEVDVKLDDNNKLFDCAITAGMIATRITSSNDCNLSSTGQDDTVRPVAGWWMYTKKKIGSNNRSSSVNIFSSVCVKPCPSSRTSEDPSGSGAFHLCLEVGRKPRTSSFN